MDLQWRRTISNADPIDDEQQQNQDDDGSEGEEIFVLMKNGVNVQLCDHKRRAIIRSCVIVGVEDNHGCNGGRFGDESIGISTLAMYYRCIGIQIGAYNASKFHLPYLLGK